MHADSTLTAHYDGLVAQKTLTGDAAQRAAAGALDTLIAALEKREKKFLPFGKDPSPKGLYLWGGVGRGKTMLMDMAYDLLAAKKIPVCRFHFHEFMAQVHDRVHDKDIKKKDNPAAHVAIDITGDARVLCFDEMEVRDIADAMIIARVMEGFWGEDGVVIATSNRKPDDLYEGGLHRERFLPFIELVKKRMDVHELASPTDFRQRALGGNTRWHTGDAATRAKNLNATWEMLTAGAAAGEATISVAGRSIEMDRVCGSLAFASFGDLCATALAARDYLAIADRVSGLFLADIPVMDDAMRNEARRFIWLVDALYDRGRFLVASAAAEIDALYTGAQWQAEFPRTASRLTEMTATSGN